MSIPPVTAEFTSELQRAAAGVAPVQSAYRLTRSADGSTRMDSGNTSMISNPGAGQSIVLDHVAKTAIIQPHPPAAPALPGMPAMPQPGAPGGTSPSMVQDLGKSVLQGLAVEGKRYVFQPPAIPNTPAVPKPPAMPNTAGSPKPPAIAGAPAVPGAPPLPKAPPLPQAPPPPIVAEVWSSAKVGLPMLTKMSGGFGQVTHVCQGAVPGEPHPAAFQIPPDYKVIQVTPPKPPSLPAA